LFLDTDSEQTHVFVSYDKEGFEIIGTLPQKYVKRISEAYDRGARFSARVIKIYKESDDYYDIVKDVYLQIDIHEE